MDERPTVVIDERTADVRAACEASLAWSQARRNAPVPLLPRDLGTWLGILGVVLFLVVAVVIACLAAGAWPH